MVQTVFVRDGAETADYSVKAVYRFLTADYPQPGNDTAMRTRLDKHGVDSNTIATDFVFNPEDASLSLRGPAVVDRRYRDRSASRR